MAEFGVAGIGDFETQLFGRMALLALRYGERLFFVMARPAGLPFSHGCHGDRFVVAGCVQLGVAGAAVVHFQMFVVAEDGRAGFLDLEDDLLGRVAFRALGDGEGLFLVVTGTAGPPFFHGGHGNPLCAAADNVEFRVAGAAVVHLYVAFVAEGGGAGLRHLEHELFAGVTSSALVDT